MFEDNSIQAISFSSQLRSVSAPADAQWQHVYPPTYKNGDRTVHLFIGEQNQEGVYPAVLLDSVQSFAHRVSEVLQHGGLGIPDIAVEIGGESVGLHEMPHRIYDAILRDSLLDGVKWRESSVGSAVLGASMRNADALWQYAPLSLLFGGWDSHAGSGTRATKLARSLAVEIIGRDALPSHRGSVRFDPLGIESDAGPVYLGESGTMTVDPEQAKKNHKGKVESMRPSEIGHGNVPDFEARGAMLREIQLVGALSLTRLRRYRFSDPGVAEALAWLGIYGVLATIDTALDLRSGCELEAEQLVVELRRGLKGRDPVQLDAEIARAQLLSALDKCGLKWDTDPVRLKAGPALEKVYKVSHEA